MTMRAKLGASGRASPRVPPGGGGGPTNLCDAAPLNVNAAPADPGTSTDASRCDHKHDVDTGVPVSIGLANAEGVADSLARSDHVHDGSGVLTASDPVNVNADPPAVGVATTAARADHKHDVDVSTPVSIGSANAEGVSPNLARSDHIHDGTTILTGANPENVDNTAAAPGVATTAARADHKHDVNFGTPVSIGSVNSAGVATTLALSDHVHDGTTILTAVAPANVTSAPFAVGVATTAARADHKHDIDVSAPVNLGTSNQTGISTALSRADHIHDGTVLPTQQAPITFNNFPIIGQSYTFLSNTIAATANNYSPAGPPAFPIVDVVRITLTGNQTMTGMAAPGATENKKKILVNVDATEKLTLTNLDGGSLAANQFSLPQALPIVLGPGEEIELVYDPTATKWVPVACTGQTYEMVSSWYRDELDRGDQNGVTITFKDAQHQRVRLTGNGLITFTFPGVGNYILRMVQDGTGTRVPTYAVTGGALRRPNGVLVLSTAAGATDLLSLYYDGTDAYAVVTANFT